MFAYSILQWVESHRPELGRLTFTEFYSLAEEPWVPGRWIRYLVLFLIISAFYSAFIMLGLDRIDEIYANGVVVPALALAVAVSLAFPVQSVFLIVVIRNNIDRKFGSIKSSAYAQLEPVDKATVANGFLGMRWMLDTINGLNGLTVSEVNKQVKEVKRSLTGVRLLVYSAFIAGAILAFHLLSNVFLEGHYRSGVAVFLMLTLAGFFMGVMLAMDADFRIISKRLNRTIRSGELLTDGPTVDPAADHQSKVNATS